MVGWALAALVFSIAGNLLLARYLRRRGEALESPAILANAIESENDIWASVAALVGVSAAAVGYPALDAVAGVLVGAGIIWGGYRFGRQNIDYLMGKSPGRELLEGIRAAALEIAGVRGVHDVRGHHVGHRVHVEVHIEVDEELRTRQSHDVAGAVRHSIERLPAIDRAFVHVDPVLDSMLRVETLARCERLASGIYAELAAQRVGGSSFEGLWTALATRAQARAERLAVVRRLKGAGYHFEDAELPIARVRERWDRWSAFAARVRSRRFSVMDALEIALDLEGDAGRSDYAAASTPADSAVAGSLYAASPPPPSADVLLKRVTAAAESAGDAAIVRRLKELGVAISAAE